MDEPVCEICGSELACIGEEFVSSELKSFWHRRMWQISIARSVYKYAHCSNNEQINIFKVATPMSVIKVSMETPTAVTLCYVAEISARYVSHNTVKILKICVCIGGDTLADRVNNSSIIDLTDYSTGCVKLLLAKSNYSCW